MGSVWETSPRAMSSKGNSYVAVVDDDESLCRSFSRLLRIAGFQAISYASAEAYLEDTKRPRFDCLVLDVQLEGMSGLELSHRLSAAHDSTPVIFITAHDNPEVRAEAEASGCAGYFRKTDPGALVLETINKAVNASGRRSEKPHNNAGKF
jgi:FixJ family two-component response regulator